MDEPGTKDWRPLKAERKVGKDQIIRLKLGKRKVEVLELGTEN